MLSPGEIKPNPYQVRKKFCHKELEKLANSIKEVGILSPVIVRRCNFGYELICGQMRLRAAVIAGIDKVPAILVSAGDAQCAQLSAIENIHRKQLGIFEEAESFYNLMMFHRIKKEKLQQMLSLTPFELSDKIKLLSLKDDVKRKIECAEIPEKTIKELLRLHNSEKQLEIIKRIGEENLSASDVRALVSENLINAHQKSKERRFSDIKKGKSLNRKSLYINTVKKTVELLKRDGANVEFVQNDTENYTEFVIKTFK